MPYSEKQLDAAAAAVVDLAVAVRDLGPHDTAHIAREALAALNGDAVAALIIAAAMIRDDQPIDRWWQQPATAQPAWTSAPREANTGPALDPLPRNAEILLLDERPSLPPYWEPPGGWQPVTPEQGRANRAALVAALSGGQRAEIGAAA